MPQPTNDNRKVSRSTSQAETLLTPAQHLVMAQLALRNAGKPGGPTRERAERMAHNHRVLAAAIAHRQRK
jgi:hypothetical protein